MERLKIGLNILLIMKSPLGKKWKISLHKKWGEKRDHGYVLIEFNALKKRHNEDVTKFIKRFNKIYNNLPTEIKPPQAAIKVVFAGAFEPEFGFTLRERKSTSLDQI